MKKADRQEEQQVPNLERSRSKFQRTGIRTLRSYLWYPEYARWTSEGGFDYRNFVRQTMIANLLPARNMLFPTEEEFSVRPIHNVDFPPSMGTNVWNMVVGGIHDFFLRYKDIDVEEMGIPPTVIEGCDISVVEATQCDFSLKIKGNIHLYFVDPFPEKNVWSISENELTFLQCLAGKYRTLVSKMMDLDPETVHAGILNMHSMNYFEHENNDDHLLYLVETISKERTSELLANDTEIKAKESVMRELTRRSN